MFGIDYLIVFVLMDLIVGGELVVVVSGVGGFGFIGGGYGDWDWLVW